MPVGKGYSTKAKARKLAAAAAAVSRARAAIVSTRRSSAPLRSGGFYGTWNRRRGMSELKATDVTIANTSPSSTGSVVLLNGIAAGDDYTNRDGRKIMMKSILMRLCLKADTTQSSTVGEVLRVIVVYDRQCNGVALTGANVLQSAVWNAPVNLDNRERFKILYDNTLTVPGWYVAAGNLTGGSPTIRNIKVFKKLNLDVTYSGTANTVGSIATGSLYLLTFSQYNKAWMDYYIRVRFTEP